MLHRWVHRRAVLSRADADAELSDFAVLTGSAPTAARIGRGTPAVRTPPSTVALRAQQRAARARPWATPASPGNDGPSPGGKPTAACPSKPAACKAGTPASISPGMKGAKTGSPDGKQRPQRSRSSSRRNSAATPRGVLLGDAASAGAPSVSPFSGIAMPRLKSTARRSAPSAHRVEVLPGKDSPATLIPIKTRNTDPTPWPYPRAWLSLCCSTIEDQDLPVIKVTQNCGESDPQSMRWLPCLCDTVTLCLVAV